MSDSVATADLDRWVRTFAVLVADNKDSLTELDAAIGDGDYGTNMDRGLQAAVAALDATGPTTASALFNRVGTTLISTVGGASGPLFGTLFLRMGAALGNTDRVRVSQLASALRAGLDGVVLRGNAQGGDKTMYDALAPAVEALESALNEQASPAEGWRRAQLAAEAGRDATAPMVARKGRASYLGARSVGHPDPGATAVALLMAAATEALR
jgi:phosphoenolpyruvate---glycerone phosphotransferase subunit DhaL